MSPTPNFHAKQEQYDQPPLNTLIHSPSTASSDGPKPKPQDPPPRPLIIYTHSPKVIHTQPRDFMALVQKLTGYTPPPPNNVDDNESTSVITEEHGGSVNDISQVNSCFGGGGAGVAPPVPYRAVPVPGFDPYFNPAPVFPANRSTDYLCNPSHQLPFYNPDSVFMNRDSLSPASSSTSTLRVRKDY